MKGLVVVGAQPGFCLGGDSPPKLNSFARKISRLSTVLIKVVQRTRITDGAPMPLGSFCDFPKNKEPF